MNNCNADRCKQLIADAKSRFLKEIRRDTGCCLLEPGSNTDTRRKINVDGKQNVYTYHIAFASGSQTDRELLNRVDKDSAGDKAVECSHLCHRRECVERSHLVIESRADNRVSLAVALTLTHYTNLAHTGALHMSRRKGHSI